MTTVRSDAILSQDGVAAMAEALRTASHDIRQPVAAILALVESARVHPEVSPTLRACLDAILRQALHISEVARTALDLESVRPPLRVPVHLDDVVDEALEPFWVTWTGTLERFLPQTPSYVLGDPGLLRRSVVNLMENAARAAGPDGTVSVRVCRLGTEALVEVEDDGPGFGSVTAGTGVGLALVRRVMTDMSGRLLMESTPGGTCVGLKMPLHSPSGSEAVPLPRSALSGSARTR